MRSFKSLVFFIILLCLTDFAYSLPSPAKAAKKAVAKKPVAVKKPAPAKKPAAPKKPATKAAAKPATTKKAAAKPTTTKKAAAAKATTKKATAAKAATTKKAVAKATTAAAKKPVTSAKKAVATSAAAKKPATTKKAATTAKAATAAKKPATTAKAATAAKKHATTAKAASAAKKPATTAKAATAAKKPVTTAKAATASKKPVSAAKKPASTAAKKPASAASKKPVATAKPINNGAKNSTTPATKKPPAKPATNSTAKACPLPKKGAAPAKTSTATKAKKKAREFLDAIVRFYRRDSFEFVGFHGTNNENGRLYTTKGSLVVPPNFNGNDGELGGGLYVTDDLTTASVFAGSSANARINAASKDCPLKDTDDAAIAVVCAVEAKSSSTFINSVSKIWIPPQEIAKSVAGVNNPAKLALQTKRIAAAGDNPANTLRFSVLNAAKPKDAKTANQVMIPPGAFSNFRVASCVPVPKSGKQFGALTSFAGRQAFPAFNYRNQNQAWKLFGDPFGEIDPEDGDLGVKKPTA